MRGRVTTKHRNRGESVQFHVISQCSRSWDRAIIANSESMVWHEQQFRAAIQGSHLDCLVFYWHSKIQRFTSCIQRCGNLKYSYRSAYDKSVGNLHLNDRNLTNFCCTRSSLSRIVWPLGDHTKEQYSSLDRTRTWYSDKYTDGSFIGLRILFMKPNIWKLFLVILFMCWEKFKL